MTGHALSPAVQVRDAVSKFHPHADEGFEEFGVEGQFLLRNVDVAIYVPIGLLMKNSTSRRYSSLMRAKMTLVLSIQSRQLTRGILHQWNVTVFADK